MIAYQEKDGSNYKILVRYYRAGVTTLTDELTIDVAESYSGSATPVICIDYNNDFTLVWKQQNGFYVRTGYVAEPEGQIYFNESSSVYINNTNQNMQNPGITVSKISGTNNSKRLVWEAPGQNNYLDIYFAVLNTTTYSITTPFNISDGDGFPVNYSPCISLADNLPVVTWTGYYDGASAKISKEADDILRVKVILRIKGSSSWGLFTELGDNVNYANNNSVTAATQKTVVIWSEGSTPQSKWIKRTNGTLSSVHSLSTENSGIQAQITSIGDYQDITAMMFNNTQLPYFFTKSNADFSVSGGGGPGGIGKISEGEEITYGRSGIASINRVEFVFNIGDVIVGDSSIKFFEFPDTVMLSTLSEMNTVSRTVDFHLDQNTQFYFSNMYYVIRQELADSLLTENDQVNFKAELVNSQNGGVIGTFDNITYDKYNLNKYASINYQVDCAGIVEGDYFLRLVTNVIGEADYTVSNIIRDNLDLEKINYQKVSFEGTTTPETYELSQNYPNPFNPSTTIKYQLAESGVVTLKVYDILGSEVATLVNAEQNAGRYEVQFNAVNYASGIYIYRLQVNDYVNTKKMILIK